MRHGVTHSLIYQHLIWQHLHKTKLRKYSDKFPSHGTATLHTHTQGCTKLFITERRAYSQLNIYIINHSATCVL